MKSKIATKSKNPPPTRTSGKLLFVALEFTIVWLLEIVLVVKISESEGVEEIVLESEEDDEELEEIDEMDELDEVEIGVDEVSMLLNTL
jgi:hypothetical protein